MELVLATSNPHKVEEINAITKPYGITFVLPPKEFNPQETGEDFESNSLIKAIEAYNLTHKPTLADDSGLCVEYLNGEPGIYSARYAETPQKRIDKLLNNMKDAKNRSAKFVCAMTLLDKEGNVAGKYGEDGCVQGILEILKIPYAGCGVMANAICMNKEYTKRILATCKDFPLIKSVFVKKGEDVFVKTKELKYPIITKPVSEGSSFGMTKVNSKEELEEAYNEALKYNDDVLIEEFIEGFFVTVGVLEKNGKPFATEILEIRPKTEWYDYEAKYTKGMSDFICPANISKNLTEEIKELSVKAFVTAGCSGVSRIDFMIKDERPYFLEINTSPGMTDTSDLPAQALKNGIDYDNLVLLILNSVGLNK